ncbi:hypothetical protein BOTBODRAFT_181740 [Botryobasidium botryosum FD-172 SS1]|uniref:Protein kinase domain-containing protein n=1 Tax=Botryobasidium botryosum (strain FD-172 SS1) TaxID=930990 RepID=A0A067LVI0_BOTB1|nr:hypothetical protein BOTBODRAFT_181740 [Botryobasidium botryosum FD-172 SS1]
MNFWDKKSKTSLPDISELPAFLEQPLPENAKWLFPPMSSTDSRTFTWGDIWTMWEIGSVLTRAVTAQPPPGAVTETSWTSFWDQQIREILMLFNLGGLTVSAFSGGEETASDSKEDLGAKLADSMVWVYDPTPYLFDSSNKPHIVDLTTCNLALAEGRFVNIRRLANLSLLLDPLIADVGMNHSPAEFVAIRLEHKTLMHASWLRTVYALLTRKNVRNVDRLSSMKGCTVYTEPKGKAATPKDQKELVAAVVCVLEALQDMHAEPDPIFHRDVRWSNVIQQAGDPLKWLLIDWDDAACPPTVAAHDMNRVNHAPSTFENNHGAEVDIWGVGQMITEATKFFPQLSSGLIALGKKFKAQKGLLARDALTLMKEFCQVDPNPPKVDIAFEFWRSHF